MKDYFSRQASIYAKFRPTYPDALYDEIVKHVDDKGVAWDCGTGNGQVAQGLAKHFNSVYATDISLDQLSHAIYNRKVQYLQFPAEETPFADDTFDLITAGQALHWFDIEKYYEEVKRVGKDNSLFACWGYNFPIAQNEEIQQLLTEFTNTLHEYFPPERQMVDEKYETIPFPFEEIKVSESFQIEKKWMTEELCGYLNSWSAVQRYKDQHKENPVDKLYEQLESSETATATVSLVFPIFIRIGKIKK
ncbi:class I SAM-dependent methyltransferase [Limibacter armeniacum]|uniref:class I SAM-dependent methyltransferase n=1 Tax=Limibacter armeniacum TaxID=466084 RepID=UPI002FE585D5